MTRRSIILVLIAAGIVGGIWMMQSHTAPGTTAFTEGLSIAVERYEVNTSAMLHRVEVTESGEAWTVGHHGSVLHWNRTHWRQVGHLPSRQWDIAPREDRVWIGGYAPRIITAWNGSQLRDRQLDDRFTGVNIYGFDAGDATLWAAGGRFLDRDEGPGTGRVLRWNGTRWTGIPKPPDRLDVFFMDVAVIDGLVYAAGGGELGQPTRLLAWNGTTWRQVYTVEDRAYHSLAPGRNGSLWLIGDTVTRIKDGTVQRELHPPDTVNTATPICNGFVGAAQGSYIVYWNETAARYTNIESKLPYPTNLVGIHAIDSDEVWITGSDGILLRGELDCA